MIPIEIRNADLSDLPAIAPLFDAYRQFYQQESDLEAAQEFLRQRLSAKESRVFLAYSEATPLGFVQLYPSFSSVSLQSIWILNDMFVLAEWRGKGVGRQLLAHVRDFAERTSAKSIVLETAPDNQAAKKLYLASGYCLDEEYLHYSLLL